MTDIIVIGVVIVLIAGVSFYLWKRKKSGQSGCGCSSSCSGCSGNCGNH
ncbi:MAG: FeoB-associated Cys-rich rane protein [Herbinix sp.]|jgi:LPXTG-motif cell wall-anchored protein|nr:FeoB-associated Cys-rich rane protein [Herbinix sp.]